MTFFGVSIDIMEDRIRKPWAKVNTLGISGRRISEIDNYMVDVASVTVPAGVWKMHLAQACRASNERSRREMTAGTTCN